MIGYKLFRVRKDGSIGPLFINRKLRIQKNVTLEAENHPTKGFAVRPGWHVTSLPNAPHLSKKDRKWFCVDIEDYEEHQRPESQGGLWYTAQKMKVLHEIKNENVEAETVFALAQVLEIAPTLSFVDAPDGFYLEVDLTHEDIPEGSELENRIYFLRQDLMTDCHVEEVSEEEYFGVYHRMRVLDEADRTGAVL